MSETPDMPHHENAADKWLAEHPEVAASFIKATNLPPGLFADSAPAPVAAADAEGLARTIWNATGIAYETGRTAARAVLASDWLAAHDAAVRAEHGERIAQAIEAACSGHPGADRPCVACFDAATLARETGRNDG